MAVIRAFLFSLGRLSGFGRLRVPVLVSRTARYQRAQPMIHISLTHDLDKAISWARQIAEDQIPFALAKALTMTAMDVKAAESKAMESQLDRPTRFTLNSLFVKPARKGAFEAVVWLKDTGDTAAREYLATQIQGGRRTPKRFEQALQRVGLMPQGWVAVAARGVELDGHGNVPAKFIVQLLSYLNAFSEQGYRANMTDKRRQKLAAVGRSDSGMLKINGVQYFVSKGKGEYTGRGAWKHGRQQHLAAGIWAKSGTHGSSVRPVFLFVPAARYRARFEFVEVAEQTINDRLMRNWNAAWLDAARTMRRP